MKRGITVEFDMHEECYHIEKKKGKLDLEEIQNALNEYSGEGQFFIFMNTENSYYDEQGTWVEVAPRGDYVKAYSYDTVRRMFEGGQK